MWEGKGAGGIKMKCAIIVANQIPNTSTMISLSYRSAFAMFVQNTKFSRRGVGRKQYQIWPLPPHLP